jgi:hypothetical protein
MLEILKQDKCQSYYLHHIAITISKYTKKKTSMVHFVIFLSTTIILVYFVFCSSTSAVFTAVLIMSSMIPLTILSLDTDETVRNFLKKYIIFRSTLIHVFNEQRVPKFTFVLDLN